MTRSMIALAMGLAAAAAAPTAFAQYGQYGGHDDAVVRCESNDGRQRFCPVDTRGGVRVARQLSRSPCIDGDTWGADRRGIWVDRGCRADFIVGRDGWQGGGGWPGGGHHGGDVLRCESRDGRWRQCPADTRRGADLVRQLSDAPCIRGRTWGVDGRGVWVSGGCRAEFRVRHAGGWGPGGAAPQVVRCESGDGRQRRCAVTVRGDVRLVRQLSRSACVEGQSWGFDRDGIWVDRGCRGEFQVTQRGGWRRND